MDTVDDTAPLSTKTRAFSDALSLIGPFNPWEMIWNILACAAGTLEPSRHHWPEEVQITTPKSWRRYNAPHSSQFIHAIVALFQGQSHSPATSAICCHRAHAECEANSAMSTFLLPNVQLASLP